MRVKEILATAISAYKVSEPNDYPTYSNIGFSILGAILERITGMSYLENLDAKILRPLELGNTSTRRPLSHLAVIPDMPNDFLKDLGADAPYV